MADIPGISVVRYAVTENTLTPGRISDDEVRRALEETGRGFIVEENHQIQAFAIGIAESGNVWALFVHPRAQGRGLGSALHDAMLSWFRAQPVPRLWLTTGASTAARGFYERRGWSCVGAGEPGEVRYERENAV
ncbi:MAG TPA: GNAT family N-acetyltransferase [Candidatus Methylomirabilis sp.]|nr:GNAT family N-acetyltransferase [Candidatus Methylomirabilis sp.]